MTGAETLRNEKYKLESHQKMYRIVIKEETECKCIDGGWMNEWVTGHGAHRERRTVDLDRAGPVASGHRQQPNARIGFRIALLEHDNYSLTYNARE